jgi:hypothetical protein
MVIFAAGLPIRAVGGYMDQPTTHHRSAKQLREEMQEQARLIADLAHWAELPVAPVHWYVRALRARVNKAIGLDNRERVG